MKAARLSNTQQKILQRMARGECLHVLYGHHARCFMGGASSRDGVRWATMTALKDAGFIEDQERQADRWRGGRYVITDAGSSWAANARKVRS